MTAKQGMIKQKQADRSVFKSNSDMALNSPFHRNGRRSVTPTLTPHFTKRGSPLTSPDNDGKLKLGFSATGFLQSFGWPHPFRRRQRQKESHRNSDSSLQTMRPRELIELASFGVVEVDPAEHGVGHEFCPAQLKNPTWCDCCGDFIWGLYKSKQCLRCRYCRYTCHLQCRDLVMLDCKGIAETQTSDLCDIVEEVPGPKSSRDDTGRESPLFFDCLDGEELRWRIERYNIEAQGLNMTLHEDGYTFRGSIRVCLNLTRPINVISGTRPPSIYDIMNEEEDSGRKTLTSFYLPRDTVKALHITSEFTVREVISALLRKFKVVDNPHKFALYERSYDEVKHQVVLRRIHENEKPLMLALMWIGQDKQFVLQENETGDIMWEAFALPELQNFLKILDREEEEYLNQVRLKYCLLKDKIQEAMDRLSNNIIPTT